jgi:hypothetical protein
MHAQSGSLQPQLNSKAAIGRAGVPGTAVIVMVMATLLKRRPSSFETHNHVITPMESPRQQIDRKWNDRLECSDREISLKSTDEPSNGLWNRSADA